MRPVLSADQMGQLDNYTIETLGIDGKLLMGSAALAVLREIRQRFPEAKRPVIFAGTGNNGGDGVALAYYAQQEGLSPLLVLCHPDIADPPSLSEDSAYFYRIAGRAFVSTKLLANPALVPEVLGAEHCDLVVDALFGTGLDRPLGDYYLELIKRLNLTSSPLVAIDCPSGLNCTSGEVMGAAVEADLTVTMGYAKRGFFHPGASKYVGELCLVQLGFASLSEAGIAPECHTWPDALWEPLRTPREADTHKGDYGKLLVVAGHRRYPGAPRLVARAALRSGAGLVRLVVPEVIYAACCEDPSVMVDSHAMDGAGGFAAKPSEELLAYMDWADALVIGPGLGDSEEACALVRALLVHRELPTVVDADGLRAMPMVLKREEWPLLLTPHVGELARLADMLPSEVLDQWFELAAKLAVEAGAFLLAKSSQCMLATPQGALLFPARGHPALASGGTGDVLSGILGALLARLHVRQRGLAGRVAPHSVAAIERKAGTESGPTAEIVISAVNIHARASHCAVAQLGEESMSATDLIEYIPAALRELAGSYGRSL